MKTIVSSPFYNDELKKKNILVPARSPFDTHVHDLGLLPGGPSHQGIFPSFPSIKINLPSPCSEHSRLHRIFSRHVYLDSTRLDVFLGYPSQAGDIGLNNEITQYQKITL